MPKKTGPKPLTLPQELSQALANAAARRHGFSRGRPDRHAGAIQTMERTFTLLSPAQRLAQFLEDGGAFYPARAAQPAAGA